jgi:hypothetical protein
VPNALAPEGRTETFASQRRLPSSMLPSFTPSATSTPRRRLKNAAASLADRMSGSVTISTSGTPLRLKSTDVNRSAPANPSCSDFPASSSMCRRVIPTRRVSPSTSKVTVPPVASGRSYCEIWYPFGRSG